MSCQFFLWNIQLVSNETSQWHKCEMELPKKEFPPTRLFRRLMKNVMAGSCTVWPHSPGASARPFFRRCLDWDILTNGIGIHQLVGLTWTTELRLNQLLTCNYRFETKRGKYHLTITRLVQPFFSKSSDCQPSNGRIRDVISLNQRESISAERVNSGRIKRQDGKELFQPEKQKS